MNTITKTILTIVGLIAIAGVFYYFSVSNANSIVLNNYSKNMKYESALNLAKKYAEIEKIDFEERLRIKNDERFRLDFGGVDMSYSIQDSVLVVRATVQREKFEKRDDFINMLPDLNEKYRDELAGGYLEYDETALEVDGFHPNRLNIRMDFADDTIEPKQFHAKAEELLIAAKRWRNIHYINILTDLNNIRQSGNN